jgi:methylmalonyl-CoA mutase N-terminal domain/subunit
VNDYVQAEETIDIPILTISKEVEEKQVARLRAMKEGRDQERVDQTLAALRQSAEDGTNMMPRVLDCARAYVTVGEMCRLLEEVFGVYEEQPVF